MKVDLDDFAEYVLRNLLTLEARTVVLSATVKALIQDMKPERYDEALKTLEQQEETVLQRLIIEHPYGKDFFDDLLRGAVSEG